MVKRRSDLTTPRRRRRFDRHRLREAGAARSQPGLGRVGAYWEGARHAAAAS